MTTGYHYPTTTLTLVCDLCGSLVDSGATETHLDWHASLATLNDVYDQRTNRRLVVAGHIIGRWPGAGTP